LAEINGRLESIEKHLGISKDADKESALVAAVAGVIIPRLVDRIEEALNKRFPPPKTSPKTNPVAVGGSKASPAAIPVTKSDLQAMFDKQQAVLKTSVKEGMLEAVKDANFRKQFKAELEKP
jgi:hypothetical protein